MSGKGEQALGGTSVKPKKLTWYENMKRVVHDKFQEYRVVKVIPEIYAMPPPHMWYMGLSILLEVKDTEGVHGPLVTSVYYALSKEMAKTIVDVVAQMEAHGGSTVESRWSTVPGIDGLEFDNWLNPPLLRYKGRALDRVGMVAATADLEGFLEHMADIKKRLDVWYENSTDKDTEL
jgi:hypothetical protein